MSRRQQVSGINRAFGPQPTAIADSSFREFDEALFGQIADADRSLALGNGLVKNDDGSMSYKRFRLTRVSVVAPDDLTQEEADELGKILSIMDSSVQFWVGDWANFYAQGISNQFEMAAVYDRLAELFGMNRKTIQNYAWICRRIDASCRQEALNFTHHFEVARLVKDDQKVAEILVTAADKKLSVRELRTFIKTGYLPGSALIEPEAPKRVFRPPSYTVMTNLHTRARRGDDRAKKRLRAEIAEMRRWLEKLESDL